MYKEFFLKSPLLAWPLASLVLFIAVFIFVVVRVMRMGPKSEFVSAMERMPIDDVALDTMEDHHGHA